MANGPEGSMVFSTECAPQRGQTLNMMRLLWLVGRGRPQGSPLHFGSYYAVPKHYTSRAITRAGFLAFYTEDVTSLLHKALPQVHQLEAEVKTMAEAPVNLPRQLKTPRAAAIAGILFAVLAGTTQVLVRLSIPNDAKDSGAWLAGQGGTISLALNLVPFAGIAFLWFMGVVRDHLGRLEDKFFSTVFVGSGLLYLGLTFVSAAVAGSLLASYAKGPGSLVDRKSVV